MAREEREGTHSHRPPPRSRGPVCPRCGSTDHVPIAYGYPGRELSEAASRGEVLLGGCIIGSLAPDFQCRECGTRWLSPADLHPDPSSVVQRRNRFSGCLLGLAVGDAVGTTLEFRSPGTFEPISDMVGGGPFGLEPGQWTDDTSMALCLAESLVKRGGFDPVDQLQRYVRWWREGHNSSTGRCFDIGNTVRKALHEFERTGEPYPGTADPWSAGNGSIMRLAPVPMYWASDPEEGIRRAADSSRTTHGARSAVDACRYMAGLIVGALNGASKEEILSERYCPVEGLWDAEPLAEEIDEVAAGSFRRREPPEIKGSGYVVRSLEAALWALDRTSDFEEGCLSAVNLGDDADTTGAVYGQIAGAVYGAGGIPEAWRERVWDMERFVGMAGLLAVALRASRSHG